MTRYPTLYISALAIWLLFLAAQAVASPTSVEHTDDTNCDPLVVPQDVDELGTSPGFANLPAEFITVNLLTGPPPMVPCPAADDPNIPDAYISITNNTGQLFAQLWYVADPIESNDPAGPPGIGTSLSNFDGFVSQLVANEPFDGGRAFRIDKTGVNKPLMIESATQDEIFEVGETWSFVIQDYMNTPGNPASALGSVGVAGSSSDGPVGTPASTGSIIGVPFLGTDGPDHFNVYNSTGPAPSVSGVTLTDQFGTNTTALGVPALFMVPADKNQEGIDDSFTHLTCYEVSDPGPAGPNVKATNQFGSNQLALGQPKYLCAPTEKLIHPGPVTLAHFQCYDASGASVSSSFSLTDQFQSHSAELLDPFLFCNPVGKNGEGVDPGPDGMLGTADDTFTTAAPVINVDFGIGAPAHVGDDGVISTPGNTVWNNVLFDLSSSNVLDESGSVTNVDVIMMNQGAGTDPASTNDLQDSGVVNTSGGNFIISDLIQDERYDLYVYGGLNTSFDFEIANGVFSIQCTQTPPGTSYVLPGTAEGDYCQVIELNAIAPPKPFDTGGGVYGIRISNIDGLVTGFQIVRNNAPDAGGHLACYNYDPLGVNVGTVEIANQFFPDDPARSAASIEVGQSFALCVPSEKEVIGPEPLDHFSVYHATGPDATAVTVSDQFGTETHDPRLVNLFMVPANKNSEGIDDRISHLTCHELLDGQIGAVRVSVGNQFGLQQIFDLDLSNELCVPTEKLITPGTVSIDHFKCYTATGSALDQVIGWSDQFQSANVTLREPYILCNPADKNAEGFVNEDDHLACYLLDPGVDPLTGAVQELLAPGSTDVVNQFNQGGQIDIGTPFAFCAPSTKSICSDTDGDTVDDCSDNCSDVANPAQDDTDGDSCGNICDADFSQTGSTGFADFGMFSAGFGTTDLNLDLTEPAGGVIGFPDFGAFTGLFGDPAGPSGTTAGTTACP